MRGRDGDTIRVDLVETEDDATAVGRTDPATGEDEPQAGPGHSGDQPGRPSFRPRRRALLVSAGVVLALAATGGLLAALDARRERERQEALAARGWSVTDLDEPLAQAWRLPVGGWLMASGEDVVVVSSTSPDGRESTVLGRRHGALHGGG